MLSNAKLNFVFTSFTSIAMLELNWICSSYNGTTETDWEHHIFLFYSNLLNSWRKREPNILILSLKEESRWVCVTKSSNSCMDSFMLLKVKKNEMEEEYPFESDIFTFNVWEIRKVLSIFTLPQFHGLGICKVTLGTDIDAAVGCLFLFFLY